jgi:hypothetical protein
MKFSALVYVAGFRMWLWLNTIDRHHRRSPPAGGKIDVTTPKLNLFGIFCALIYKKISFKT